MGKQKRKKSKKKRKLNKKIHYIKLLNKDVDINIIYKWVTAIILTPIAIQIVGKFIKFPFVIYFFTEYILGIIIIFMIISTLIIGIHNKGYIGANKLLISTVLIISIALSLFIFKDMTIPMTKDIPALIKSKYQVKEFYIANVRNSNKNNPIISDYIYVKSAEIDKEMKLGAYYPTFFYKGQLKTIEYLPNSKRIVKP